MKEISCIYLDDETTWPAQIRDLLAGRFGHLKRYVAEERRIDKVAEKDISIRVHRPGNPHRQYHDEVLKECVSVTADLEIAGFHATRLHESEIESIKANGIRTLSADFLAERIRRREADGDLPANIADALMAKNQAGERYRRSMIWFVFNKKYLDDEGGFSSLYRYWGGESLYNLHSEDGAIAPWLEKLGMPCLIEAAIPLASIASVFTDIPKRMVSAYLQNRGVGSRARSWHGLTDVL